MNLPRLIADRCCIESSEPGNGLMIYDEGGHTEEQAKEIVLRCNLHDELLEALQGVLRVADRATDEFDAARAAIAKATGDDQ